MLNRRGTLRKTSSLSCDMSRGTLIGVREENPLSTGMPTRHWWSATTSNLSKSIGVEGRN